MNLLVHIPRLLVVEQKLNDGAKLTSLKRLAFNSDGCAGEWLQCSLIGRNERQATVILKQLTILTAFAGSTSKLRKPKLDSKCSKV